MTGKEGCVIPPQLRESCIRTISNSTGGFQLMNAKALELEIFRRATSEDDYRKRLAQFEVALKEKFGTSSGDLTPVGTQASKSETLNNQQPKAQQSPIVNTPKLENSDMESSKLNARIALCRSNLQDIVDKGPTLQSTEDFIDACKHWLKILLRGNELTTMVVERCEMFLKKRGDSLDEIDLKILEIKSEDSKLRQKAHLVPTIVNETPIDCDADEAISCLKKLSINSSAKKLTNLADSLVIDHDPVETSDKNTSASESSTTRNQAEVNLNIYREILQSKCGTITTNSVTSSNIQTEANSQVVPETSSQANKSSYRDPSAVVTTQSIVTIQPTIAVGANHLNNSQNIQIIPISSQRYFEQRNEQTNQATSAEIALIPPSNVNRNNSPNAINITPIQSKQQPQVIGNNGQRFTLSVQSTTSTIPPSYGNNSPNAINITPVASASTMGQLQQIVSNIRYDQSAISSQPVASTSTTPTQYAYNSRIEQTNNSTIASTAAPINNMRIEQTNNLPAPVNQFPIDNIVRYAQICPCVNTSESTPPRPQSADCRAGPSNHFRLPTVAPQRSLSVERAPNDHQPTFDVRPSSLLQNVLQRTQSLDRNSNNPIRSDFAGMPNNQPDNNNLSSLIVWRNSAREGLIKSIMQIEDVAYANSQNKDQYLNFFQEIFIHARNKMQRINITNDQQSIMSQLTAMLDNEPANIQNSTAKDWVELEATIAKITSNLDDAGVDQAFDQMNLLPDIFETQMTSFLKVFQNPQID